MQKIRWSPVLLTLWLVLRPASAFAGAKGSSEVKMLTPSRAGALWHHLHNDDADEDEITALEFGGAGGFGDTRFKDEFDRRSKIAKAKKEYATDQKLVLGGHVKFEIVVRESLGEYDFDSHTFPVGFPDEDPTELMISDPHMREYDMYGPYHHLAPADHQGIPNERVLVTFHLPDEFKAIKVSEARAKALINRITEVGRTATFWLELVPKRAFLDSNGTKAIRFSVAAATVTVGDKGNTFNWDDFLRTNAQRATAKKSKPTTIFEWKRSAKEVDDSDVGGSEGAMMEGKGQVGAAAQDSSASDAQVDYGPDDALKEYHFKKEIGAPVEEVWARLMKYYSSDSRYEVSDVNEDSHTFKVTVHMFLGMGVETLHKLIPSGNSTIVQLEYRALGAIKVKGKAAIRESDACFSAAEGK